MEVEFAFLIMEYGGSLFRGTERTGTDDYVGVTNSRNEGVYNSIASALHTRVIMSQRIAVCALSIPKILDLLNDDESDDVVAEIF